MMQKLGQNFVYKSSRYNLECSSLPSRAFPELHRAVSEMALLSDVKALMFVYMQCTEIKLLGRYNIKGYARPDLIGLRVVSLDRPVLSSPVYIYMLNIKF